MRPRFRVILRRATARNPTSSSTLSSTSSTKLTTMLTTKTRISCFLSRFLMVKVLRRIVVVSAAIAVVYAGLTLWSVVALRHAYAALERDGRPMTAAEVIPPPVPDADNAAPLYEEAFRRLKSIKVAEYSSLLGELAHASRIVTVTNATPSELTNFYQRITQPEVQQVLDLVVKAGERKTCRFNLDYASANGSIYTNISEVIGLTKIVRGETRRLSDIGENSNAWRMAIAGLRLAEANRMEPFILSQLIETGNFALADSSLRRLCAVEPPTKENVERILATLTRLDDPTVSRRRIDGERVFGETPFRNFTRRSVDKVFLFGEAYAWERCFYWCAGMSFRQLDHAAYLRMMRDKADISLSGRQSPVIVPRFYLLTRLCLPAIDHCRTACISHLARVRCTKAGLAALMYKKEHGAWPETLEVCMKQVPTDPFDGKPLRYRVTEKGFVVSRVGKEMHGKKEIAWEYEPIVGLR